MRFSFGSWVLLGLLTTVCAFGQTPARKRPPTRTQSPHQTVRPPIVTTPAQPLTSGKLVRQILDSLRARPDLRTVTIPLADLSVSPATAVLTAGSQAYLDSVVVALNHLPTLLFDVVGYATALGDSVKSRLDAEKRAGIVWSYLASDGKVVPNRMQYRGYSNGRLAVSKNSLSGLPRNPQVRLKLTGLDTSRVVVLYLTNTTTVETVFAYEDDATGMFFYKTAIDAPLLSLPISQVSRITDKPREIPLATAASTTQADGQPKDSKPAENASGAARLAYRYTTLTIGAEGLYVLPALSPQWADDAIGLGLRQGVGGALALTRRFGRWAGLSVQAGYGQWETWRLYTLGGETQYDERAKLQQISAQVGLKLYVWNNLYLMPAGGAWGIRLTASTSKEQPIPPSPDQQNDLYWGYTGRLGYEWRVGRLVGEMYTAYQVIKPIQPPALPWRTQLNSPFRYLNVGATFGFGRLR